MAVTRPSSLSTPFADQGAKNTIPVAPTGNQKASYQAGFPTVTMMPLTAGGIPPEGKDFNGVLNALSGHTVWVNTGGQYVFDATLASTIGGYPKGAVLQSDDGRSAYVSLIDNNSVNFNTTPSSIGVQWLPYAGDAVISRGVQTSPFLFFGTM